MRRSRRLDTAKAERRNALPSVPSDEIPILQPSTVLVVDDDGDVRFVISEVLRHHGYSVIEASSGEEAERAALTQVPQLILMDIAMPGVDGLSVVWRLRAHAEIVNVPIVIVSAYDAYDLRSEAAAQGCRGYLKKPLDIDELIALVDQIVVN